MTGHQGAARPGTDVGPMDAVDDRRPDRSDRPSMNTRIASTLPSTRWRQKLVFGLVFCAAMAATGVSLWAFVLRDRLVPKRFGVVVPGEVYRSGQISRYLIRGVIEQNQIGTIIDLNGPEPSIAADQQAEAEVSESTHVRHYRFPLRGDGTGKIERYADAIATLTNSQHSGVPVLVHCTRERSGRGLAWCSTDCWSAKNAPKPRTRSCCVTAGTRSRIPCCSITSTGTCGACRTFGPAARPGTGPGPPSVAASVKPFGQRPLQLPQFCRNRPRCARFAVIGGIRD